MSFQTLFENVVAVIGDPYIKRIQIIFLVTGAKNTYELRAIKALEVMAHCERSVL